MKDREDQLFYTVNDCLLSIKLLYMIGSRVWKCQAQKTKRFSILVTQLCQKCGVC